VRLQSDAIASSRREVFEAMRKRGIGVNLHYIPVHTQPYYLDLGFRPGDYPEAERYYAEAMTMPMFPTLAGSQQDRVVDALREALQL
jgi:dTDP-4-amino-4,6-dideoxygalactose transaminase